MKEILLVCSRCAKEYPFENILPKCSCGGTLLVEYNLESAAKTLSKEALTKRAFTMWRYHELLPVLDTQSIVTLGEGGTPLLRLPALEKQLSIQSLWVKREEQNPTGSFKARGFSAALTILRERGVHKVTVPSNGNAASALSAYAARAGMEAFVFLPKDCPPMIVEECLHYGAKTFLVDGMIHDAAQIIEDGKLEQEWFNVGTLREPGRAEGKKTMGFELAEQLNWTMPDVIVYPTGGGSGVIGLWKAFCELKQMKWISGDLPRIVCIQEQGCQPIVDAFARNLAYTTAVPNHKVTSNPTGMRVPNPPDGNLLVRILQLTGGTALTVTSEAICFQMDTL